MPVETEESSVTEIHIRSEEVQDILEKVPNWMIRWGNTLLLFLILGLFLISWFIKYPDTITGTAIVTTVIPPEKIYARSSGRIDALLVTDKEIVSNGKVLGIIENSANYKDVLLLKNIMDTLQINYEGFYFPLERLPILFLGEVEPDYSFFERNYAEYILNKKLKPFSNKAMSGRISLNETRSRLNILISQQTLNRKEVKLIEKDLERYKTLAEKGAVSIQELDQKKLEHLQAQRLYRDVTSSISQLKEIIKNTQNSINGTMIEKEQEDRASLKSVVQAYNQLKNSIKNWELKYVLLSSIEGRVSFLSYTSENQAVTNGDLVFTIIPKENSSFVAKVELPPNNSGKIKLGQRVNVRLSNYPHTEFGMLNGTVENISLVPDKEGNFLIDVKLPDRLITTYNKKIRFKQEMRGTVEIITEDLRLVERFFYQLKNIINK